VSNDSGHCVDSQVDVYVADVGLSDHHLLTWPLPGRKVLPASQTVCRRPWHQLDVSQLRDELKASSVYQPAT